MNVHPSAIELLRNAMRRPGWLVTCRQVLVLEPRSILNRLELAVPTLSRSAFGPPALESTSAVTPTRYRYKVLEFEWFLPVSLSQRGSIFGKIIPENFGLTIG